MKRCVTGSAGDDYYVRMYPRLQTELEGAIDQCMQTSQERKLYGKFMNIPVESASAYLLGVLECADIMAGIELPGLENLYSLTQEYGINAVLKAIHGFNM